MSPRLPDQSTDSAPVLASDKGDERICVPKPSSEGERVARGGSSPLEKEGIIVGVIGREVKCWSWCRGPCWWCSWLVEVLEFVVPEVVVVLLVDHPLPGVLACWALLGGRRSSPLVFSSARGVKLTMWDRVPPRGSQRSSQALRRPELRKCDQAAACSRPGSQPF